MSLHTRTTVIVYCDLCDWTHHWVESDGPLPMKCPACQDGERTVYKSEAKPEDYFR